MKLRRRYTLGVTLLMLLCMYFWYNWSAIGQDPDQASVRPPGERRLHDPEPVFEHARQHLDFAYLSEAAYDPIYGDATPQDAVVGAGTCPRPGEALSALNWKRWQDFPPTELRQQVEQLHLRVHVWERASPPAIAVAFGGTLFHNLQDWRANFRWFIPAHEDQYTAVVERIGPALINALKRRREDPSGTFLRDMVLYTTGHSLGGGLAQQFAYALPLDPDVRRVSEVYVFDPSPVTGFYSVASEIRDVNRRDLRIFRIYERGEILASIRLSIGLFYPPSASAPAIWNIRYDLVERINPLAGHSIADLACGMHRVVGSRSPPPAVGQVVINKRRRRQAWEGATSQGFP